MSPCQAWAKSGESSGSQGHTVALSGKCLCSCRSPVGSHVALYVEPDGVVQYRHFGVVEMGAETPAPAKCFTRVQDIERRVRHPTRPRDFQHRSFLAWHPTTPTRPNVPSPSCDACVRCSGHGALKVTPNIVTYNTTCWIASEVRSGGAVSGYSARDARTVMTWRDGRLTRCCFLHDCLPMRLPRVKGRSSRGAVE
jgi:hypothetical protein